MSGGEDYELLFTAPARHREKILQLGSSLKVPVSCVGEIRSRREGFHILGKNGRVSSPRRLGFEHFKKR
jgi:thiamine-monophosphate kinase